MYAVTNDYKTAIVAATRTDRITGTITLADTSTVNITDADIVKGSLYINDNCVPASDFDIGAVESSELSVSLFIDDDLSGAKIELDYGIVVGYDEELEADIYEDVPLGVFYVAECPRESNYVKVRAVDGMLLLEEPVGTPPSSGTPYDFLDHACTAAGVTLENSEGDIQALPNGMETLTYPEESEIETCRDLVMWITVFLAGFAWFNRDGNLEIKAFTGASVATITKDHRDNTDIADSVKSITTVGMMLGRTAYFASGYSDTGAVLQLDDNPIARAMSGTTTEITNIVSNGSFDGTTDWSASEGTISAGFNTLSITGNGTGTQPQAIQTTGATWTEGNKIYVKVKYRVTNSSCLGMKISLFGSTSGGGIVHTDATPTINEWYTASEVAELPAGSGYIKVIPYHVYADAGTANGKVMQCQYAIAIDLTDIWGAGCEPSKEEIDLIVYNQSTPTQWFDGSIALENANIYLDKILAEIDDVSYHPFSTELLRNNIALEPGDLLTFTGGVAGAGMDGLLTNSRWNFRGKHTLMGAGKDNALPIARTQVDKKNAIKADIAYITDIFTERILAGDKVTVGTAGAQRLELYASTGNPLIDMYDTGNNLRAKWGYTGLDFYDSTAASAERIATTTANATITVGPSGKDYTSIQDAINSLPKFINHDIVISIYDDTYAEDILLRGFSGSGTLTVQSANGQNAVSINSVKIFACNLGTNSAGTDYSGLTFGGYDDTDTISITEDGTMSVAVKVVSSSVVSLEHLLIDGATPDLQKGVLCSGSKVKIHDVEIKDKTIGIQADYGAIVSLDLVTGSGNSIDLRVRDGGIISHYSQTLFGDTVVVDTDYGGLIVPVDGAVAVKESGWIDADETWEYVSATSFTVPGDQRNLYSGGTKIRWEQDSGVYYSNAISSTYSGATGKTTVTKHDGWVSADGDCDVLDTATYPITGNAYSRVEMPTGFPGWFNWTPTFAGFSSNPSGGIYKFKIDNTRCTCVIRQPTAGTSNATNFTISAPVTSATITNMYWGTCGAIVNAGTRAATPGDIEIGSNSSTISVNKDTSAAAWTNSGDKRLVWATLVYEI
jgi:hypothetical protein